MEQNKERLIIIRRVNPNAEDGSAETKEGMVFMLTENGTFKDDLVDAMLVKVDAATLPDKRTTVVSALLRNNFIITETSCCVNPEDYNMELAVEICMNKIKAKIKDYLAFIMCSASVSVEQLIEFDKVANEKVE